MSRTTYLLGKFPTFLLRNPSTFNFAKAARIGVSRLQLCPVEDVYLLSLTPKSRHSRQHDMNHMASESYGFRLFGQGSHSFFAARRLLAGW